MGPFLERCKAVLPRLVLNEVRINVGDRVVFALKYVIDEGRFERIRFRTTAGSQVISELVIEETVSWWQGEFPHQSVIGFEFTWFVLIYRGYLREAPGLPLSESFM